MLLVLFVLCSSLRSGSQQPKHAVDEPKGCDSELLKTSVPEPPDVGLGHYAYVYQVTNSSQQTCTLSGVARVRLLDEHRRDLHMSICSNCDDYMFASRPSEVVPLRPGRSAHLMVGVHIIDAPGHHCVTSSWLAIFPVKSSEALLFKASWMTVCDTITVSAWRAGIYEKP
jgi:hypothetical protein